jgi:hypothetical protein
MMEDALELVEKAGRLVNFGLRARLLPANDGEYLELVREYLSDARLQQIAERMLRGLGLRVLGAGVQAGLTLGTAGDGPFRIQRDDYHARMFASDRIIQGLIHLAIGAWCFPRAEDLGEADEVLPARLSVEQLTEYIHSMCEELKGTEENNVAVPSAEIRMAWQYVLALGKFADSSDGRRSFATLAGKVRFALDFLADHGFLKREGPEGRYTWLARPAFRIHVREMAGHEAFAIVSRAAQEVAHG